MGGAPPADRARDVHVVLTGLMAAGKTSVGRRLAVRLHRPFVDNDEQVRELAGRAARDVLERDGVEALRAVEAEALREALARREPSVVAAAAGVVLDRGLREVLRAHAVVWLRAPPEVLAARVRGDGSRPWLERHVEERLAQMEDERGPLYREIAQLVVDAGDRSPLDTAAEVVEWLEELGRIPAPAPRDGVASPPSPSPAPNP